MSGGGSGAHQAFRRVRFHRGSDRPPFCAGQVPPPPAPAPRQLGTAPYLPNGIIQQISATRLWRISRDTWQYGSWQYPLARAEPALRFLRLARGRRNRCCPRARGMPFHFFEPSVVPGSGCLDVVVTESTVGAYWALIQRDVYSAKSSHAIACRYVRIIADGKVIWRRY